MARVALDVDSGGLGIALPAIIRWLLGWDWYSRPVTFTTVLFLMPIGFILGIGCFDYWGRYIIGSPTSPRITPITARTAGRTTSRSTPITR